jgi:hypothetical protein
MLVKDITSSIRLLREVGIKVGILLARGILLGHIQHAAPELFHARAADGSVFKGLDTFVRKFLLQEMNYVPRKATRAAQKVPADAETQMMRSFLRNVAYIKFHDVRHPELVLNWDQTPVIVQDRESTTFAERGSKQVAVVGKEEKRAWTSLIAVSKAGEALPTQIVMKGGSVRSLPPSNAPMTQEANARGITFVWNPKNYWSSHKTMRLYVEDIVVPYFQKQKKRLGLSDDQVCVVQLDVWSVHKSREFRRWIRRTYPWIILDFVPGGLTGLWQVCDVGIARPYKQAIRRAQLEDIVAETQQLLADSDESAAALRLDVTIGTLRTRSVRWYVFP